MKKILITGANSYIGTSFEKYMAQWPDSYQVDTVDMIDGSWREKSFAGYDIVYHVAGIAHIRENAENIRLYFRINRDLAIEVAKKARQDGVGQFIFMSSMSVYGLEEGAIDRNTPVAPRNNYGKSKLQAEEEIVKLRNDSFAVAVLRPPMVYGEGCKGNFQALVKFAKVMPFFPDYKNQRSMIHIDRLCRCLKELVDSRGDGLFLPQDENYVCTCEMVQQIGRSMGREIRLCKLLNPAVSIVRHCTTLGRKAFGDLYYVMEP